MNAFTTFIETKHQQNNFQDFLARLLMDIPQLLLESQKILFLKHKREDYLAIEAIEQMNIKLSNCHFESGNVIHSVREVHTPAPSSK